MRYQTLITASLIMLAGCASQGSSQQSAQTAPPVQPAQPAQAAPTSATSKSETSRATENAFVGTPAKNSKFSKITIGMSKKEVEDLIGPPNDMHMYTTGKAWIPFYMGKDAYRFETTYKKEGSLTFEGGGITGTSGKLIRIVVDANASGYVHSN